ncbi:MAG: hypothetical protein IJO29_07165 [Oscillospiraceae bacterium]|nr:hypothetical protein [Oscillospiraceae bacterium]
MNIKKALLTGTSYAAVAALAIGGTMALFTDSETQDNVMTVGKGVDIEIIEQQRNDDGTALEDFKQGKELLPMSDSAQGTKDKFGMPIAENYVDKIVTVGNIGETDAYVRVIVGVPAALEGATANDNALHWNYGNRFDATGNGSFNDGTAFEKSHWNEEVTYAENGTAEIDGIVYNLYSFTYTDILESDDVTDLASIVGFYLDEDVNCEDGVYTLNGAAIDYDFSQGVVIPVFAQAIQASGYDSAAEAFAASGLPENPWSESESTGVTRVASVDELTAAIADGGTILLTEDLDLGDTQLTIAEDTTIILGGNDITGAYSGTEHYGMFTIASGATLTIEGDGDVVMNSEFTTDNRYGVIFRNNGTLNINGGNYRVTDATTGHTWIIAAIIDNYSGGSSTQAEANIYDGTFAVAGKSINLFRNYAYNVGADAELNIYGGEFKSNEEASLTYIWNQNQNGADGGSGRLNFYGGTYDANVVYEDYNGQDDIYIADGVAISAYSGNN